MIKLNDITVNGVMHSNVFTQDEKLDFADVLIYIDYKVDTESLDMDLYNLTEEDMDETSLKHEFASYMRVTIYEEMYKNIDNLSFDEFEFMIVSDICPEIEETVQYVSTEQKRKAFCLVKEYLKSVSFEQELNDEIEREIARKAVV